MVAGELFLEGDNLTGKNVTLISSVDPKRANEASSGFDHLVIENQKTMSTKASNLAQFVQKYETSQSFDYFPLRMILAKERATRGDTRLLGSKACMEISRRFSLALAAFTYTLIGIAFGMQIGRAHSRRGILYAIGLASAFMIAYIAAKSFRYVPFIACLIYILPHPLIVLLSLKYLKKVSEEKSDLAALFFKEIGKVFFLFLFGFFFLYAAIDYSVHMQDFLRDKKLQLFDLGLYYGFQFVKRATLIVPLALLIATIKVMTSLTTHKEWMALQVAGVSFRRLMRPFLLVACLCTLFNALSSEFLLPKSLGFLDKFYYEHLKHSKPEKKSHSVQSITLLDNSKLVYQTMDPDDWHFF